MLNDRPWYWTSQEQNGWSPLAVQNRPADEDPGLPGATTTNGPGTALPRCTGQGSALPKRDAGEINHTTLLKQEKVVTIPIPCSLYSR